MFEAIILGIVQGVSEFLPISSSAHLVLIPYIFNWDYQGLSFDVALHAGTALALLAFFWKDWLLIIKNAFLNKKETINNYPKNLLWQIVVASIPAAILGFTIHNYVENIFHFAVLIAFNLAFWGWLLWRVDKKSKSNLAPEKMTYAKSFLVGIFQAIALIPGVSRSGVTITAGRLIGLPRTEAARFSFLLATPAIVGAFVLKLPDILKQGIDLPFIFGVLSAALFGFMAIKFLLAYLKKSDFSLFFWYRLVLAVLAIIVFFVRFN